VYKIFIHKTILAYLSGNGSFHVVTNLTFSQMSVVFKWTYISYVHRIDLYHLFYKRRFT